MSVGGSRNFLQNALLIVASVGVGLVLLEAGLRIVGYNQPMFYVYDEFSGTGLRPDLSGWVKNESVEYVRNDGHGFRIADQSVDTERPITRKKPPGTFRIAVLGDSYTESHHVSYAESFPTVLERRLRRCAPPERRVKILNFGVSGYNTAQELMSFRHRAKDFEPDLVMLVFHANNDLIGNYRKLERNPFIPYGELRDGRTTIDVRFRSDPAFKRKLTWSNLRNTISNEVRLLQLITNGYGAWINRQYREAGQTGTGRAGIPAIPLPAPAAKETATAQPDVEADYFAPDFRPVPGDVPSEHRPPTTRFQEMLWRLAEGLLIQLHDAVRASGADFALTSTATGITISPDESKRAAHLKRFNLETTDYAGVRLSRFADDRDMLFIPLAKTLQEAAVAEGINLEFFETSGQHGHWNARAHTLVGDRLAEALCPLLRKPRAAR